MLPPLSFFLERFVIPIKLRMHCVRAILIFDTTMIQIFYLRSAPFTAIFNGKSGNLSRKAQAEGDDLRHNFSAAIFL
jgi:hypothetical protein